MSPKSPSSNEEDFKVGLRLPFSSSPYPEALTSAQLLHVRATPLHQEPACVRAEASGAV